MHSLCSSPVFTVCRPVLFGASGKGAAAPQNSAEGRQRLIEAGILPANAPGWGQHSADTYNTGIIISDQPLSEEPASIEKKEGLVDKIVRAVRARSKSRSSRSTSSRSTTASTDTTRTGRQDEGQERGRRSLFSMSSSSSQGSSAKGKDKDASNQAKELSFREFISQVPSAVNPVGVPSRGRLLVNKLVGIGEESPSAFGSKEAVKRETENAAKRARQAAKERAQMEAEINADIERMKKEAR